MGGNDDLELGSRNEDPMKYSPGMISDWRYEGSSLTDTYVGLVPLLNSVAVNKEEDFPGSSSYPSASMDTFGPDFWEHSMNLQNLGFGDTNVHNNASASSMIGIRKAGTTFPRTGNDSTPETGWSPTSSLLKGSVLLPTGPGILPKSLSQIPTDSAFIERAARFSCFGGGNFSDVVYPFSISSRNIGLMHGAQELADDNLKPACERQSKKKDLNVDDATKDASLSDEHQGIGKSLLKTDRRSESLVRSNDGEKHGADGSGDESDEAEFSGGVNVEDDSSMLEGTGREHSKKVNNSKKRKRVGQESEKYKVHGTPPHRIESPKDNPENQHKGNQKAASTSNKTNGKHGKQGSQVSDSPKEEYIHVRARRGQATNSHSLAERVRREKISERMKFLQDLVPGCSKVTGKAVMLDEIINYVQSLQRQVEFLSMKLATVNPRLDFNIEGLLAKDHRAGTSSALGLSHDISIIYPPVLPSHPGMVQEGIPAITTSSDILRRTINPQLATLAGGYKEHTQLSDVWDDDLHNVVQISYGMTVPLHRQDTTFGSMPGDHMNVEL